MSVSRVTPDQLWFSLGGFLIFYSTLLIVEIFLMQKYIKRGPSSLHTGRYADERGASPVPFRSSPVEERS